MSRAFVSEDDGWHFCIEKHESCVFADEQGKCMISYCRKFGEQPPPKEEKGK